MTKILSWLILMLSLASCYHSSPETSFNMKLVLPADSMVTILSDLHTVEGIFNVLKDNKQPVGHLANEYFEAVLKNHAIDKEIFQESMRYYAFHTEELDKIYERVIINLSMKESMINTVIEPDSLSVAASP